MIPARCCADENNVNADLEPQHSRTSTNGNGNPGERWTINRSNRRPISLPALRLK